MLANYLNELLKKSKLCWKCFLEISPFKPGHSSLSRHRCCDYTYSIVFPKKINQLTSLTLFIVDY